SRPQRLCLQGLAKLVLRPPSPLLQDDSVHSLVDLWTTVVLTHAAADVRAEATAALKATANKSAVLAHHVRERSLPPLMHVVASPEASPALGRSATDVLKDVLAVLAELSTEPSIFMALVLPLCQLGLGINPNQPLLQLHPQTKDIASAVANIVRLNQLNVACIDACVLPTTATTSVVQLLVDTVVHHVRQQLELNGHALLNHDDDAVTVTLVPPTAVILGVVMQHGSIQAQETLLQYVLSLFLTVRVHEIELFIYILCVLLKISTAEQSPDLRNFI
ncbi:hypothetical protein AaE_003186, partial [Aphanomyces astaci]